MLFVSLLAFAQSDIQEIRLQSNRNEIVNISWNGANVLASNVQPVMSENSILWNDPKENNFYDDFENGSSGNQIACTVNDPLIWDTWDNSPCSYNDAYYSNEQVYGGNYSMKIEDEIDMVHLIDNLISGIVTINFEMYIPSGKLAYWNTLQLFDGSQSKWGMQIQYQGGTATLDAAGASATSFSFPYNTWMHNTLIVNLTADQAELIVDGTSIYTWVWSEGANGGNNLNQLGGNNFYGWTGKGVCEYYIDNYTIDCIPGPEAITDLAASVDCPDVNLTWTYSGINCTNFSNYNVYRNGSIIGTPTMEGFTDTDPGDGNYLYVVRPVCDGSEGPESNTVDETVACNFSLPEVTNLNGTVNGDIIDLNWDAAYFESPLDHSNGFDDGNAIGLTSGGTFYVASKFDLGDNYYGTTLDAIEFAPAGDGTAIFTLKVWEGNNGLLTLIHEQEVTAYYPLEYNYIELTTPVFINPQKSLWFGYETTHQAGNSSGGIDDGPAEDGGDMISMDGINFVSMNSEYGLDYNWAVRGYISYGGSYNIYYGQDTGTSWELLGNTLENTYSHTYGPYDTQYYRVNTLIDGMESDGVQIVVSTISNLNNDLSVIAITSPSSGFNLGSEESLTVNIKNMGADAQSNFNIYYSINGANPVIEVVTETVSPGDIYSYTFMNTLDLSSFGSYNIEVCSDLTGDQNNLNDCFSTTVLNQNGTVSLNYLGSAGNIYYALLEEQQAMTYDPHSNLLQMIHRANPSVYPEANDNGAVVSSLSLDGGNTWSYKMLTNGDGTNLTRYPQGYIYNADHYPNVGATIIGATGPSHTGGAWNKNFFASGTNSATFISTKSYLDMNCSFEAARYGTAVTDNGYVYALSTCTEDDGSTYTQFDLNTYRGIKDTDHIDFGSTYYSSIDPLGVTTYWYGSVGTAWSQDGSIGYVFGIGLLNDFVGQSSYNPIVWKSTDNGTSWQLIVNGMNMVNFPGLEGVLVISNDGNYIPLFNSEVTGTVDANGNLQFFGACYSGSSIEVSQCPIPLNEDENMHLMNVTINPNSGITAVNFLTNLLSTDVSDDSEYAYSPGLDGVGWSHRLQASRSEDGMAYFIVYGDTENASYYNGENAKPDIYIWGSGIDYANPYPPSKMTNEGTFWFHYVSDKAMAIGGNSYQLPVSTTVTQVEMLVNTDLDPVTIEYVNGLVYSVPFSGNPPEITQQPQGISGCEGESLSINVVAINAYNYQWYKYGNIVAGATNSTLIFNPSQASQSGDYYCVISSPGGSVTSDVASVTILVAPNPNISGDMEICNGESTTLDAGSGFASYLWNNGSNSQTITVSAQGTYWVTVSNGNGCNGSDEVFVIVESLPQAPVITADNMTPCEGDAAILSVTDPEVGVTYFWNNGEMGNTISVEETGNYNVYGDNGSCIGSVSNELTIIVYDVPDLPTISTDDSQLCEGDITIISINNTQTGVSYIWNTGEMGYNISVSEAGNYFAYGDNGNCQTENSEEILVEVQAYPIADFISDLQTGEAPLTVQFEDNSTENPISWNWNFGDGGQSLEENPEYTYNTVGLFEVTLSVTTSFGCEADISKMDYMDVLNSIDEFASYNITFFPNPTSGEIRFSFGDGNAKELKVKDITGKILQSIIITGREELVDLSNFEVGIYLISIYTDKETLTTKIIKE